jgi:hypothetical protein
MHHLIESIAVYRQLPGMLYDMHTIRFCIFGNQRISTNITALSNLYVIGDGRVDAQKTIAPNCNFTS